LKYYINFWKQLKKKNKRNEKSFSSLLHGNHGLKGRPVTLKLKKIKEYNDLTRCYTLSVITILMPWHSEPSKAENINS